MCCGLFCFKHFSLEERVEIVLPTSADEEQQAEREPSLPVVTAAIAARCNASRNFDHLPQRLTQARHGSLTADFA